MSEGGETTRLIAWSQELRRVHTRLREALWVVRQAGTAPHDLLLYCHGFCAALDGHHRGEDSTLFPAIAAAHPELRGTLHRLEQDHSMIAHLLGGLRAAVDGGAAPDELARHLDGLGAIMESHFRHEERALLTVLDRLALTADPADVLGPL
ncbi:hemerythrin domain-containing protein [Kineosporia sp. J2-2]|uniref:Hemerythrin domain-containing protein n=1 Tax=Kineosporia corallincola TaxID=2835133 RepID=A0ABS5TCI7_9ACTN|nr:hemerythrin domain-containing protein [Kineosporia corallincola]MBT0768799.1 hemerythrin domain-containing protein [Kineosporia corallincola]